MALTNYERGRNKEYRIMNRLKAQGKIAIRSAGSHSPIDVIGIDMQNKTIELIQSKLGKFSEREKANILETYKELNSNYLVKFTFE